MNFPHNRLIAGLALGSYGRRDGAAQRFTDYCTPCRGPPVAEAGRRIRPPLSRGLPSVIDDPKGEARQILLDILEELRWPLRRLQTISDTEGPVCRHWKSKCLLRWVACPAMSGHSRRAHQLDATDLLAILLLPMEACRPGRPVAGRSLPVPALTGMIDIWSLLFENYLPDACPEPAVLAACKLSAAGFERDEISAALSGWTASVPGNQPAGRQPKRRWSAMHLTPRDGPAACRLPRVYAVFLEQQGPSTRRCEVDHRRTGACPLGGFARPAEGHRGGALALPARVMP